MSSVPKTIHVPPTPSATLNLSRDVCAALAARTGDPTYNEQEVVHGLSSFLRICGTLLADQMQGSGEEVGS